MSRTGNSFTSVRLKSNTSGHIAASFTTYISGLLFVCAAGYHGQKLPLNEPYPLAMGGHKDKEEITVPQYGSDDVMLVKLSARTGKVLAAKAWYVAFSVMDADSVIVL